MKRFIPVYYLLFILLVMGTFSSMAQNSYGLKIMGGVAFVFALIFLIQAFGIGQKQIEHRFLAIVESLCLVIISVIFGLRVLYIFFSFLEYLFVFASAVLAIVFVVRMIERYRIYRVQNSLLAVLIAVFHASVILFLISLAAISFAPLVANGAAIGAFVMLVAFLLSAIFIKKIQVQGAKVRPLRLVAGFKDHSVLIATLLLLFSLFTGLNRLGWLPDVYSDQYPRAYFKLVNDAAANKDSTVDGKFTYQRFLEQYQLFLRHSRHNAR